MANDLIKYAFGGISIKTSKPRGSENFLTGGVSGGLEHLENTEAPPLCISSIWLFLSCILYNKLVNIRSVFLSFVSQVDY